MFHLTKTTNMFKATNTLSHSEGRNLPLLLSSLQALVTDVYKSVTRYLEET